MFRGGGRGVSRRGGYGGYSQRGRGRGRGAATANKKWVRPAANNEANDASKDSVKQQTESNVNVEGSSSNQAAASFPTAANATQHNVVLKGPKRYPTTKPANSKSNTWKRPRDESKSSDNVSETAADINAEAASASTDEKAPNNEKGQTKPSPSRSAMLRRGKHKLISQNPKKNETNDTGPIMGESGEQNDATTAATIVKEADETSSGETGTTVEMKKRGRNKLVLATPDGESSTKQSKMRPIDQESSVAEEGAVLARKGKNKLVLQQGTNDAKGKWDSRIQSTRGRVNPQSSRGHVSIQSGRGHGRGRSIASGRGVKRIRLNPSEEEGAHESAGNDQEGSEAEGEEPEKAAPVEKYTEFAYRQSSSVSQRGRGRGRSGRGRGGRNMGLVRVEPDAATTRMCPTYLRGEPCTNPKCSKRHDVPKEAAVPICSFFQRNGMCNKGDACQFRHIKVNPHATVCPSFSLLGFCDNKDCVMKHVRAPKKKAP